MKRFCLALIVCLIASEVQASHRHSNGCNGGVAQGAVVQVQSFTPVQTPTGVQMVPVPQQRVQSFTPVQTPTGVQMVPVPQQRVQTTAGIVAGGVPQTVEPPLATGTAMISETVLVEHARNRAFLPRNRR